MRIALLLEPLQVLFVLLGQVFDLLIHQLLGDWAIKEWLNALLLVGGRLKLFHFKFGFELFDRGLGYFLGLLFDVGAAKVAETFVPINWRSLLFVKLHLLWEKLLDHRFVVIGISELLRGLLLKFSLELFNFCLQLGGLIGLGLKVVKSPLELNHLFGLLGYLTQKAGLLFICILRPKI